MVKINLSNLRGDFTGGLTAGIVALPLALALGVASGLGPMAGLYGAIAVGFFAALFGGTPAQISGPTGPMVVVLAGLFASLSGDASLIFTAVILAGIFQIVFGVLGIALKIWALFLKFSVLFLCTALSYSRCYWQYFCWFRQ